MVVNWIFLIQITFLFFKLIDSYAKLSLIENGVTQSSYKTSVRKNNANPVFNEVAVFEVATRQLANISLKIVFYQVEKFSESVIGSVCINARKQENFIGHWQQMLRLLRRSVRIITRLCNH